MLTRPALALALATYIVLMTAQQAFAHAQYRESQPPRNESVGRPPDQVSISFTEPPAGDAEAEVIDGCGSDVSGEVASRGDNLTIAVSDGQPGEWTVDYSVISLVDGHPTDGDFSFRVKGNPDCEAAAGDRAPEAEPGGESSMTSGQLVLVAVTSALVAVFTMLLVATLRRARIRDD